jgi:hypothetical protein
MLGWFRALMPKDDRFFDLFARHSRTLVQGAVALEKLLQAGDAMQEHAVAKQLCSARHPAREAGECVKWLICLCKTALPRGDGETGDRAVPDAKAKAMVTDL